MKEIKTKIIFGFFLIALGIFLRLFMIRFVRIPNLEVVTSFSLISGGILGGIFTILVPLGIIAITDMFLGNHFILIFTWSAFAVIGVFGWLLRRGGESPTSFVFKMTGGGILASLFFYLYTNFGWWLLTAFYPHNLKGLIDCYIMGLPFLKMNLAGNLLFVPVFTSLALFAEKYYPVLASKIGKIANKAQSSWAR